MDKAILIAALPQYRDEWVMVTEDQNVHDIISDILAKHKEFAPYYDRIALYFDGDSIDEICETLYTFCKKNIKYKEEKDSQQTTALPTGLLIRGYGDCKHYASFIGGVLDGLNRMAGKKIKWNYRFVSYNAFNPDPHHVFIVVNDNDNEIWIDPTPGADKLTPSWVKDRYIKNKNMPLISNIGNVGAFSFAEVAADPQVQQSASQLVSSVTDLLTNLISSINIGDQVPDYPIKSQTTLQGILADMKRLFPTEPTSIADAQSQLTRAKQYAAEAYAKGGDVNVTYGMIYDEVAATLQNYINTHNGTTSAYGSHTASSSTTPTGNNNTLLLLGAAGLGAFVLLSPGKKKSVNGLSPTNLLLLFVGGFIVFKMVKGGGSNAGMQRIELIDWSNSTTDPDTDKQYFNHVVNTMTDQEVADTHDMIFNYLIPGKTVTDMDLRSRLNAISIKYQIFT